MPRHRTPVQFAVETSSESRFSFAVSTALVGRLSCGPGTLSLLCCGRLTLHLSLRILRGSSDVASRTIHRAGWRMLIGIRTASGIACRTADRGTSARILHLGGLIGTAGPGQRRTGTDEENSAARERKLLPVHFASPRLCCWTTPHARPTACKRNRGARVPGGKPNLDGVLCAGLLFASHQTHRSARRS